MEPREQLCAIYTRISDDRDGKEVGVKNQELECEKLAKVHGLKIHHVYTDNDIGASVKTKKKKEREKYIQMLKDARKGDFQYIIAYSNSRLTRRLLELEELILLHEETTKTFGDDKGVIIYTVASGNDDLSKHEGRMTARIKASVDSNEAERISSLVKMHAKAKARRGEPGLQHRRPFGFKADAISHEPAEAAAIREAVQEIIAGASITDIRRKWDRLGVQTTDGLTKWGWSPVKRVLLGWRTVGIREYRGKPLYDDQGEMVRGVWQPIISLEEREAALQKLKERTRASARKGEWLLQGLLKCSICGRTLYGALQKEGVSNLYTCTGGGSSHMGINAPVLEHYIRVLVVRYELEKAIHGRPKPEDKPKAFWPSEPRLSQLVNLIDALMVAFNSGEIRPRDYFKQLGMLNRERDELERSKARFEVKQLDRPSRVATIEDAQRWFLDQTSLSFPDLRQMILNEIDYILIKKGAKGYGGRTPDVVRESKIRDRAVIYWKDPHYEWNGVPTEDLLDSVIPLTGVLVETAPSSVTASSGSVDKWTPETVLARIGSDDAAVREAPETA